MSKVVYAIKKTMTNDGNKTHVFVTDNHSEILESKHKNIIEKMVEVFNANTDNGCKYELITIGK